MNAMQPRYTLLGILLLLAARPVIVCAADVTAKVIDRLGRPVANAVIDIHWLKSVSKDDVRKIDLVKLVSDRDGIVKGTYDEASVPKDEDIWVEVSKTGYSGYSTTGLGQSSYWTASLELPTSAGSPVSKGRRRSI